MHNKNSSTSLIILVLLLSLSTTVFCQYKDYKLSPNGDTLNAIDNKGLKQGKWVSSVGEIRGEPGYEEEGFYKDDKRTGVWRRYNSTGDMIAMENYLLGGKDGIQEYFTFLGTLERHEEWRGYNPDAPYDTVAIYGTGSNEVIDYKLVKAEQYSVKHGEWRYYDPGGSVTKIERYDRGSLMKDAAEKATVKTEAAKPKEKVKTKEILEYEKKYSKKKRAQMERDGKTGL
jgi:antitoxin component YwqK of YwqJK toxin-antitoxin module